MSDTEHDYRADNGRNFSQGLPEEYRTGRFTKQQLLKQVRTWGLTNRRGKPLTSQAIGVLLRNQIYAGIVDVPEYGARGRRGEFEPLVSEELF